MSDDPLYLVAALAALVALSEWLVRRTFLRHLGTALVVIVLTAVAANLGVVPTGTRGVAVYEGIFEHVAPLAIFWLLLGVDLRAVLAAGRPMLLLFLLGALGTTAGAALGMWAVGGAASIGPKHAALAGMFAGTYTGGSVNFNAVALEYRVMEEGLLFAGATAVDSILTTLWMVATIALPRLLRRRGGADGGPARVPETGESEDTETAGPADLASVLALGAAGVWFSGVLASSLSEALSAAGARVRVPDILVLTAIALVLAQVPAVRRLRGPRLLGMLAVHVFLAVIGAYCDLHELARLGELGATLALFASVVVAVHGLVVFGSAALLRVDPDVAAVASQANVGGGTSALALARSLGRPDLVLPAILVGSLGNGIGTFLGFGVVWWLSP